MNNINQQILNEDNSDPVDQFYEQIYSKTSKASVTTILVALNIAYYLFIYWQSKLNIIHPQSNFPLIKWGANYPELTASGQSWRLLSCTFIHFGLIHLGLNMFCLYYAGQIVERVFGNASFALLYLTSGIGGSLASLFWLGGGFVGGGASGAVFGVLGALGAVLVLQRKQLPTGIFKPLKKITLVFVIGNLAAGTLLPYLGTLFKTEIPNIDNSAHIGGLLCGFLSGLILFVSISIKENSQKALYRKSMNISTFVMFFVIVNPYISSNSLKYIHCQRAIKNFERKDKSVSLQIKRLMQEPTKNTMELLNILQKIDRLFIFWEQTSLSLNENNQPWFPLKSKTYDQKKQHSLQQIKHLRTITFKFSTSRYTTFTK
ncbi:MAG: rhomboid family intramembrane serine protease [Lentisphaeraceae bacterium]|nr:rhomboid family intramembrane serine protease [Lentisphaeraceae bacterium]